jgi:curved DNA-binding protein CbpA
MPVPGAPRPYDPAELEEDVELTPERKQRILDLFYRLDELSYYEILGVAIGADKKEVKRAYYELAPEFHPDKYFRKRLGGFTQKIETIFARLTLAHDVLTHRTRRAEYDAYLEQVLKNRSMAAWMNQPLPSPSPSGGVPVVTPSPPPAQVSPDVSPSNAVSAARAGIESSQAEPRAPMTPEAAAEIDRIRRQTLARKLSGGLRRSGSGTMPSVSAGEPGQGPSSPPGLGTTGTPAWPPAASVATELEKLLKGADTAAARGDFVSEVDALRAALTVAPLNPELRRRWRDAQERAVGALAQGYVKQAGYEASEGRWAEASWSYAKAASLLSKEALPHERVAFATLAMGGSPQRAIEFAKRAVELAPSDAGNRVTLARAYLAAGKEASGREELERAQEIAPGDPRVQSLAAELTRRRTK